MRRILTTLMLLASGASADVIIRDDAERTVVRYDRSYALLIGVSDYTAGWRDLPSIPGELAQVEAVLGEHDFEITKVLDPTEDELRQAFEDFIDAHGYAESHRLLVYFAGHGYSRELDVGLRGYLVPTDAPRPTDDPDGFLGKAVPMTQVVTWARNIEAKHTLFVFDSCFSGTVFDTRGELSEPTHVTTKMGRSVRQFLTAGSAGEEVPAKSVFTPAFVRALRGDADLVLDGYITGTELGVYLDQKVDYTGQTPQSGRLRGYHEGDFVFQVGLPKAPEVDFDLSDLRPPPEVLASWTGYQEKMDEAYAEVEKIEDDPGRVSTRIAAWTRFLETFEQDNPYSTDDERLRGLATGRVEHWRSQAGTPWTDPAIGMKFRYISPGSFLMGSPEDEPGRFNVETRHVVILTQGFWMGETEVTQGQWREVMGNNPAQFPSCGDDCPVDQVNWYEAVAFANALSEKAGYTPCYRVSGSSGKETGEGQDTYETVEWVRGCIGYRLPTEAEWERAARGGTITALYTGGLTIRGDNDGPELDPIAWYGGNSEVRYSAGCDCSKWNTKQYPDSKACGPHPVGEKMPNRWGLHDTLGNVWEWTWDWWGIYENRAQVDPVGPAEGTSRVFRGGSWSEIAGCVRAAYRNRGPPSYRWLVLGFRLARGQEMEKSKPTSLMDASRFAQVKKGMTADEVRDLLGPVKPFDIRDFPNHEVRGWFYPTEGGGAAGVYFLKPPGSDIWTVYAFDFEAVKPQ